MQSPANHPFLGRIVLLRAPASPAARRHGFILFWDGFGLVLRMSRTFVAERAEVRWQWHGCPGGKEGGAIARCRASTAGNSCSCWTARRCWILERALLLTLQTTLQRPKHSGKQCQIKGVLIFVTVCSMVSIYMWDPANVRRRLRPNPDIGQRLMKQLQGALQLYLEHHKAFNHGSTFVSSFDYSFLNGKPKLDNRQDALNSTIFTAPYPASQ